MQKVILALFCTIPFQFAFGQIETVPIPRTDAKKGSSLAARTKAIELDLPFWEDFSTSSGYPNNSLWLAGQSTLVNDVMAIDPPSVGVATFDGLDSLGKPYSVNQVLAKGFADLLSSQIIRLDKVVSAERSSVYFSFFYQITGLGEAPDLDDQLTLSFKDSTGKWEPVWSLENDGTGQPDQFYQVIIPVNDEKYYHDKFQFRFQNFARLSGPFDTWNLDYVYLNKGRSATDLSFPDRTISRRASSMFKDYTSIPITHFIINPDSNLSKPSVGLHNMENLPGNPNQLDVQPVNYTSLDSIISYSKMEIKIVSSGLLDDSLAVLPALQPLEHRTVILQTLPAAAEFNLAADSLILIKYKYWVNTGDNVLPSAQNLNGDYDVKYSPIDFRVNDTIEFEYQLEDYYAYDDGTAEFGAAINLQGAQVAYEFNMTGVQSDTLVAINLYFPRFGDESSQVIELRIWSDLSGDPIALLYKEIVSLQRSQQNIFWRKKLLEPVTVGKKFYVGWRQLSSAFITVGLDKNTDSSTKMFFNTAGSWSNSTFLKGSLMIRPVIGDGPGTKPPPNTGLQEERSLTIYPNPSAGTFHFDGQAEHIWIHDLAGKPVAFDESQSFDQTVVSLLNAATGLYVIRVLHGGKVKTFKVIVQ